MQLRQDTCELPNGHIVPDYYVVEERHVGQVFALTADRQVILVEQYKHAIGDICLELPGGIFEQDGADHALAEARRELIEETGYDAREYVPLGTFLMNPTRLNNCIHTFFARDAFPVGLQNLDEHENITLRLLPLEAVLEKVRNGQICAQSSVAGIYAAWDYLSR